MNFMLYKNTQPENSSSSQSNTMPIFSAKLLDVWWSISVWNSFCIISTPIRDPWRQEIGNRMLHNKAFRSPRNL